MADFQDITAIHRELVTVTDEIILRSSEVAKARAVREYDSDRRKRLLAECTEPHIAAGDSATAAEVRARASAKYREGMGALFSELQAAEKAIAADNARHARLDALRSIGSGLNKAAGL